MNHNYNEIDPNHFEELFEEQLKTPTEYGYVILWKDRRVMAEAGQEDIFVSENEALDSLKKNVRLTVYALQYLFSKRGFRKATQGMSEKGTITNSDDYFRSMGMNGTPEYREIVTVATNARSFLINKWIEEGKLKIVKI